MANSSPEFKQALDKGASAAWDQEWDVAAQHYREALEISPDHTQALMNLGLALYELDSLEDALPCYERARQLMPDDPAPVEKMAEIYEILEDDQLAAKHSITAADMYLNIKDPDKAIENWTRVVRVLPEHVAAHSRLALVHERLGRRPQAITELLAVASLQQHEGKQQEALETLKHAQQLNQKSKEVAQALEMLQANKLLIKPSSSRKVTGALRLPKNTKRLSTGRLDSPETQKETPDPITEASQKALGILAEMMFEVPGETEALEHGGKGDTGSLMAPGPDRTTLSVHLGKAIDLHTRGETMAAANEIKDAIGAGFDHPAAYFLMGSIQFQFDRKEGAVRALQRSVTHQDFSLAARLLTGEYLLEKNKLRKAAEEYLEALKIADVSVVPREAREELSQLYESIIQAQSRQKDKNVLTQLCTSISNLLMRPNWRINLLDARKQLPKAVSGMSLSPIAEILIRSEGNAIVEVLTKINHLAREGHYRSAMEEAYAVLDQAPTYLPLHIQMGELLLRQNRNQEAIEKFTIVAESYSSRGESIRATDMYSRIVGLSPMDLNARNRLIDQLIARGDVDEALKEYMNLGESYYRLAELDMARVTYEKALRVAQQSNDEDDWNVQILFSMADIDLQRLNWRQAMRVFEQLKTLNPENQKARKNLIELNMRMAQEVQAIAELDSYITYLSGNAMEE
ncbi:MAG: tetratricopeptide repeat protein [Chloroflexota bacterium]